MVVGILQSVAIVGQCCAVIGLVACVGGDGQLRSVTINHRQYTFLFDDVVVAGNTWVEIP